MRKWVFISSIVTIITLIVCQLTLFTGFDKNIMESLNINFLTEILGVIFTFFIVERLLSIHEMNAKRNFVKIVIQNEYKQLINKISQLYITFVTKNPPQTNEKYNTLKDVVAKTIKEIDDHVHSNFIRNNIKVLKPVLKNGGIEAVEEVFDYQHYCVAFKGTTKNIIDNFLLKYISRLPDDIVSKLSNINNILLGNIFSTALDSGLNKDISNATFNPEHFKEPLKELGNHLLDLYNYSK